MMKGRITATQSNGLRVNLRLENIDKVTETVEGSSITLLGVLGLPTQVKETINEVIGLMEEASYGLHP
jgi:hypothetical protein